MFLDIKNLSKHYAQTRALHDVCFSVEKGSITCILGPSGCGKTTILRAVGGFVTPTQGQIFLDAVDISAVPPEERPVSTVFQSYGLFPHKNVLQNVMYGLKFLSLSKQEQRKRAYDLLDIVDLRGYESKRIDQLSGGEQQRVALARSLVVQPDLLLLDEPFSSLDATLRIAMRKEIQRIQKQFGITMLFVTHDQEDAFSVADQIVLMDRGEIVQISSPMELYHHPTQRFSLDFIGESNRQEENGGLRFVRPEQVIFAQTGEEAVVCSHVFQGATIEYTLKQKKTNAKIKSLQLNRGEPLADGATVYLQYELEELKP